MGFLRTTLVSGGGGTGSGLPLNGGKSQINLGGIQSNGDYPFINMMKASAGWGIASIAGGPPPDPDDLDMDGYPTNPANVPYDALIFMSRQVDRPGEYILRWDGTGSFADWTGSGITGGSLSSTGTGYCKGTPWTDVHNFGLRINSTSVAPNNIRNIRFYHVGDQTDFEVNGEIFGSKLRSRLAEGKFGVIRFMDWQNNNTNHIAKWADNKALTHYSYYANEYRGAAWGANRWYFGATTNAASDGAYAITTLRARAPLNGDVIQLKFNIDAGAKITAAVTSGANTVLTISTGAPNTTFNTVGESVCIGNVGGSWASMNGTWIVQARAAGSVTINFNSGGLPAGGLSANDPDAPLQIYHATCTLNVDATGPVKILSHFADNLLPGNAAFPCRLQRNNGSGGGDAEQANNPNYATLVYNSVLNAWIKQGGDRALRVSGMGNATPPQAAFQLALRMGAHPWFNVPIQAVDPMTDYVTQLATYCRDNAPSWMVPRFEPPNECFNNAGAFFSNSNMRARSAVYGWPASGNEDYVHVYGKVTSTIGQDLEKVYGTGPTNRAKYVFLAGVWTIYGAQNPTSAANVLTSATYLAQAPPAQSGYNKTTPASAYVHGVCPANYYGPSVYGTPTEATMAAAYAGGDTSQVPAYLATCYGVSAGFNLERNKADCLAWRTIALNNGVTLMEFYEGGFSPDYDSNTQINALKSAAKYHVNLRQIAVDSYANDTGISQTGFTARFPSHYYLSGNRWMPANNGVSASVWALLDDLYETPGSAQWQAIVTYNA